MHRVVGQVFVEVLVVDLDHRGVDTCTKALNFLQSEESIFAGLVHANVSKVFHGLNDISCLKHHKQRLIQKNHDFYGCTYTSEHAGSGAANLKVILANLRPVEHGIESGDFIHLHGGHFENLCCLVHGRECQEVIVLLLGNE